MKTILAIALLALAGCAGTLYPKPITEPPSQVETNDTAPSVTTTPAATIPDVPEMRIVDPIARALTSATFTDHANRSLAIAGTTDPIFSNCVLFGLTLGQELRTRPLIQLPTLALASADPSCPLCLLAAKRKDAESLASGSLLGQIAEVRGRARDIQKRATIACAPLFVDEQNMLARLAALFGAGVQ